MSTFLTVVGVIALLIFGTVIAFFAFYGFCLWLMSSMFSR